MALIPSNLSPTKGLEPQQPLKGASALAKPRVVERRKLGTLGFRRAVPLSICVVIIIHTHTHKGECVSKSELSSCLNTTG